MTQISCRVVDVTLTFQRARNNQQQLPRAKESLRHLLKTQRDPLPISGSRRASCLTRAIAGKILCRAIVSLQRRSLDLPNPNFRINLTSKRYQGLVAERNRVSLSGIPLVQSAASRGSGINAGQIPVESRYHHRNTSLYTMDTSAI